MLYLIGAAVVLIFGGTLIAVWLLMYVKVTYQPPRQPEVVHPRRATMSWCRRNHVTEFRIFVGGPGNTEMIVLDVSDEHLHDLAVYVRDLERHGNSPLRPSSPTGSASQHKFSLIDGGKEED